MKIVSYRDSRGKDHATEEQCAAREAEIADWKRKNPPLTASQRADARAVIREASALEYSMNHRGDTTMVVRGIMQDIKDRCAKFLAAEVATDTGGKA